MAENPAISSLLAPEIAAEGPDSGGQLALLSTISRGAAFQNEGLAVVGSSATSNGAVHSATMLNGISHWCYYKSFVKTDQAGTLNLQGSNDGTTFITQKSAAIVANTPLILACDVMFPYYRTQIVNGATAETSLVCQSAFTDTQ